MTDAELADRFAAFFKAMYPHADQELRVDTDLLGEWFVDSFGIVQTVQFIEDTFDLTLARADIHADNFASIRALVAFVREKLG